MIEEERSGSFDAQLDAIGHPVRRQILFALLAVESADRRLEVEQLVDPPPTQADRLEIRHTHLPKLRDRSVVETTTDPLRVSRGTGFDRIQPLLQVLAENREQLPIEIE